MLFLFQTEIIPPGKKKIKKAKSPPKSPNGDIQLAQVYETSEMVHFRLRRYNQIESSKIPSKIS